MTAVLTASSVLCAGGRGTEQLWATVRAGISTIKTSVVLGERYEPLQMSLVPQDALKDLPPSVQASSLPSCARRMLQLAAAALAGLDADDYLSAAPLTIYLGLPEFSLNVHPWFDQFFDHLSAASAVPINVASSRIFPLGTAAAFAALEAALVTLAADSSATILVGGVDTFLDLCRLSTLVDERRILCSQVMDGFIPGEGAAFLILRTKAAGFSGVQLHAAATQADPGHRYGPSPALGEGLSNALEILRATDALPSGQVATTFAGLNGENFDAKLWGVAQLRHSDWFARDGVLHHPADCIGDTGAASGAILTALAAFAIAKGQRQSPALTWSASDSVTRGCALLTR